MQTGESEPYAFDVQLETVGEASHRLPRQHFHLLMDIVVVGQLEREIFRRFNLYSEDNMTEEVVSNLRKFGRILELARDGVDLHEGIVVTVMVHIPTVERMERDMVANRHVLQPLRERKLQIEGQHLAIAGRVGTKL